MTSTLRLLPRLHQLPGGLAGLPPGHIRPISLDIYGTRVTAMEWCWTPPDWQLQPHELSIQPGGRGKRHELARRLEDYDPR